MFSFTARSSLKLARPAFKTQSCRCMSSSPVNIDHIKHVGVIGSGQMGLGIAYVAANVTQLPVVLMDISKEQTDHGLAFMNKLLEKDVAKNKMTANHANVVSDLIKPTNSLQDLDNMDIVIETALENLKSRSAIFGDLDKICKSDCILAFNTSSISITKIGAATKRAEKVNIYI